LVVALGTHQQTCIVKITVLGQNDLPLYFGGVVHHREDAGVEAHREVLATLDKGETNAQIFVGGVEFFHEGEVLDLILGAVEVEVEFGSEFGGFRVDGFFVLLLGFVGELALLFLRKW
jgi:hypothetical protein